MMIPPPDAGKISVLAGSLDQLLDSSRRACVDFLLAEIRIAHTLLDVASSDTTSRATRQRLRERAAVACDLVSRHITAPTSRIVTDADRDSIGPQLAGLRERMASSA